MYLRIGSDWHVITSQNLPISDSIYLQHERFTTIFNDTKNLQLKKHVRSMQIVRNLNIQNVMRIFHTTHIPSKVIA